MKDKEDLGIIDQRRLKRRDNIIQLVILNWILKQKQDIREKTGKIGIQAVVQLQVLNNINFQDFIVVIMEDGDIGKAWGSVYQNSLYYFCTFSVSLKLFENKVFFKNLIENTSVAG